MSAVESAITIYGPEQAIHTLTQIISPDQIKVGDILARRVVILGDPSEPNPYVESRREIFKILGAPELVNGHIQVLCRTDYLQLSPPRIGNYESHIHLSDLGVTPDSRGLYNQVNWLEKIEEPKDNPEISQ